MWIAIRKNDSPQSVQRFSPKIKFQNDDKSPLYGFQSTIFNLQLLKIQSEPYRNVEEQIRSIDIERG